MEKQLQDIYETYISGISYGEFVDIYNNVVNNENHNFLYINCDNMEIRKNFNYIIKNKN